MATATQRANGAHAEDDNLLSATIRATEQRESASIIKMRMEGEQIMTECRQHPRDFEKIKEELAALLRAFPEFADDAIYCKPVGKDQSGKQTYAEGLSIRAAEALAEMYKYNRVRCEATVEADGDRVKLEACFVDFQNGRSWEDAGFVSAFYKSRGGQMQRYSEDRFYNTIVKAQASIRIREVILRSVNASLKAWFENECRKVAQQRLTPEVMDKCIAEFKGKFGVTLVQLESAVGKPRALGWMPSDMALLRGIFAALRDEQTTVAEAFPADDKPSEKKPPGPVSGPNLTNASKQDAGKPSPESAAAVKESVDAKVESAKSEPIESQSSAGEGPDRLANYIAALDSLDTAAECDKLLKNAKLTRAVPKPLMDRLEMKVAERKAALAKK